MSVCILTSGYSSNCTTFAKAGGLEGRVWVLNLYNDAGVKLVYEETVEDVINSITLPTGSQAFIINSASEAHNAVTSTVKPGINSYFGQVMNIRLVTDTPSALTFTKNLVRANKLVFIVETLNQEFKLYGQNNGMQNIPADIGDTGQTKDSDLSELYSFNGGEIDGQFKFVDVGGYDATLAYLVGLETVVV